MRQRPRPHCSLLPPLLPNTGKISMSLRTHNHKNQRKFSFLSYRERRLNLRGKMSPSPEHTDHQRYSHKEPTRLVFYLKNSISLTFSCHFSCMDSTLCIKGHKDQPEGCWKAFRGDKGCWFHTRSGETSTLIPPQEWSDRKSTGLVTLVCAGYLSRKSSSTALISLLIRSICNFNQTRYPWATRTQSGNIL